MGGCISSQKPEEATATGGPAPPEAKPAAPANPISTPVGTGGEHAPSDGRSSKAVEPPSEQLQGQLDVPVQQPAPNPEIESASSIDAMPTRPSLSPSSGSARFAPFVLPAPLSQNAAIGRGDSMLRGSSVDSSSSDASIPGDGLGLSSNESSQPPATDPLMKLLLTKMSPAGDSRAGSTRGFLLPSGAQMSRQGASAMVSGIAMRSHVSGGAGASWAASRLGSEKLDYASSGDLAGWGTASRASRPSWAVDEEFSLEGARSEHLHLSLSPFTSRASSAQQQLQQQAQLGRGSTRGEGATASTPAGGSMFDQSVQPGDLTDARMGSADDATTVPSKTTAMSGFSTAVDLEALTIPFNELEIMKQVGEGSFGRVYMAKWRETLVAVKLLLNTGVNLDDMEAAAELAVSLSNPVLLNLRKEASLMAALRHPNIVGFRGVCPTPPCVVSDFCSRGSLNDVLRAARQSPAKAAQLDWVRRLNMALDAANGMLYLHLHRPPIIHRDLKSPNLLVDKHWWVKVCDFNLSKIMEDTTSGASMSTNNPRWLAPEVLDGQGATLASDVYSFGVVLWEMLTLELPWGRFNQWQIMKMVSEGRRLQVPARPELPPSSQGFEGLDLYQELIRKCWAKDPKERPTFAEIIGVLREMLGIALKTGQGSNDDARPVTADRHRLAIQAGMQEQAQQQAQLAEPGLSGSYRSRGPEEALSVSRAGSLVDTAEQQSHPGRSSLEMFPKQEGAEKSLGDPTSPRLEPLPAKELAGDVAALVRQLEGTDKHLQEEAARALLDLACSSPEDLPAIVSAGAVPRLLELLGSLERHPQDSAIWAILNLQTTGHGKLPSLLSRDNLPTLARLLENVKEDVQELRVSLLKELVTGREEEQAQALQRVVELTGTSAVNREEATNAGLVPMLLDLLRGGGRAEVKRSAAEALANLCMEPAPAASVVAAKGIPLLVQLSQGDELQGEAAKALLNLAYSSPEHLYAVVSAGGIPPLVALLGREDKTLQGGAARLVAYLCQRSPDYQSAVVSAGAVPRLVRLLESSDRDLQAPAARAVGYLSYQLLDFRSVLAAAGAIPALVRLLYSSDEGLQVVGAWALACMADLSRAQQTAIVAAGAIPPLVRLLVNSTGADVQAMAARAVACLSDWSPVHRLTIVSAGAVPPLVQLLDSPNKRVQGEAARALAYLWTPENQAGAATVRGVPFLRGPLEGVDKQVQEEAIQALGGLPARALEERHGTSRAKDIPGLKWLLASTSLYQQAQAAQTISCSPLWIPSCQFAITSVDVITPLMRLLKSANTEVQARAAWAVAQLCVIGPEVRLTIISEGGIPALGHLLEDTDNEVQELAAIGFAYLAGFAPLDQRAGMAAGAVPILLRLLEKAAMGMQETSVRALLDLAQWSTGPLTAIVAAGIVPRLVELLGSMERHKQARAAWAIAKLSSSSPKLCSGIVSASALPPLVQLLESTDTNLQQQALCAIANLAFESRERSAAIVSADATPHLVRLLGNRDENIQEAAARALASLAAGSAEGGAAIVAAGALPLSVQLLESKDEDVQGQAVHEGPTPILVFLVRLLEAKGALQIEATEAIANLSHRGLQQRIAIVEAGAIGPLVRLLRSANKQLQECAAGALANLAGSIPAHQSDIVMTGAIPPLVQLLHSPNKPVQQRAALAIANLAASNAEHANAIVSAGAVPPLVRLLESGDNNVQSRAVRAIGNLATTSRMHVVKLLSAGTIPPLVRLLDSIDEDMQQHAAGAIASLAAGNDECVRWIMAADAVPSLVRLLGSKDRNVQLRAARALVNLASSSDGQAAIVSADAIPAFLQLLESKDADVQLCAAGAIANLAPQNAKQALAIMSVDGISALVRLLQSRDKDLQLRSALTITNLAAGNAEHKVAIVSAGAMPPLMRLLESKDKDVQLYAARALVNLAAGNAEHEAAIASAGAITPLMQLLEAKDKNKEPGMPGGGKSCLDTAQKDSMAAAVGLASQGPVVIYGDNICTVCLEENATAGYLHGNTVHRCLCEGCIERAKQQQQPLTCPFCRACAVIITGVY